MDEFDETGDNELDALDARAVGRLPLEPGEVVVGVIPLGENESECVVTSHGRVVLFDVFSSANPPQLLVDSTHENR